MKIRSRSRTLSLMCVSTLTTKIHAMSDELKRLKANIDGRGVEAHARYSKVKADFCQTIRDL